MLTLLIATLISPVSPDIAYKQPQAAASQNRVVITFGAKNAIYVAVSEDGGKAFGKPVKVSDGEALALGMRRGPRISVEREAIVVSAIAKDNLLAWRSTDGGRTWSGAARINDVDGSAREGLHAMDSGGGLVFVTWLDLRSKGTKLYGSVSRDGGLTWSKNTLVYESPGGSICECCHPSLAVTSSGVIYVMFRNSLSGARNMYLAKIHRRRENICLRLSTWLRYLDSERVSHGRR